MMILQHRPAAFLPQNLTNSHAPPPPACDNGYPPQAPARSISQKYSLHKSLLFVALSHNNRVCQEQKYVVFVGFNSFTSTIESPKESARVPGQSVLRIESLSYSTRRILMKASLLITTIAAVAISSSGICQEQPRILVGVCGNLKTAKEAGFDYVELGASGIAAMPDADFEKLIQSVADGKIPVRTTNGFLPGGIRVTGPNVDTAKQMEYLNKLLPRLHKLGVKVSVLGSGKARDIQKDFSPEENFKQMVDFCKRLGPVARSNDIFIAIEPLNKGECNFINTVIEGLELVKAVNDPNIKVHADIYHMAKENESADSILKAGADLKHVHIATPKGRGYPSAADDFDYKPYFAAMKKIGYTGGISIEGGTKDFKTDGPRSAAFLKDALQK